MTHTSPSNWINEPARQTPVTYDFDVVIAGGGASGVCAAIAAARNGARTLLIEQWGFCGGNATIFLPLLSFLDQQGNEVIKGIGKEIIDRVIEMGGCIGHGRDPLHVSYAPVDPEVMKRVVIEKLEEAGVHMLLHTMVVGAFTDSERITHIITESKSGRRAVAGKWFIDATGDGDLAVQAGAKWEKGNEQGNCQPATLMFRMGDVDINECRLAIANNPERFGSDLIPTEHYINNSSFIVVGMRGALEDARAAGDFPLLNNRVIFITQPRNGEVSVNMTRIVVDATDVDDLSRAEVQTRKDVWTVAHFLQKYVPGFQDSYVIDTAHRLGIRESRRIMGEYVLDRDDILSCRRFEDSITVASYPIDLHDPNGTDCKLEHPSDTYDIPFRCLEPLGLRNLLIVGRCISATHQAMAAIRVMPIGMALGEAGGTAAAMAFREKLSDIRELAVSQLRKKLAEHGARV